MSESTQTRKLSDSEKILIYNIVDNKLRLSMNCENASKISHIIIEEVYNYINSNCGELWYDYDIETAIGYSILKLMDFNGKDYQKILLKIREIINSDDLCAEAMVSEIGELVE